MTTLRSGLNLFQFPVGRYVRVLTRETGHGLNTHRSNRAKNGKQLFPDVILNLMTWKGLYHGKDIRSGNTISFSHHRCKRKWYPNVINKKVWSESLNDWVRFQMTTAALKGIDYEGGIDNYILGLDERSVQVRSLLHPLSWLTFQSRIQTTFKRFEELLEQQNIYKGPLMKNR
jgi:ribosomal protein L28